MEFENIHTLINKYWNCETSTQEEQILQDFFSQEEIPDELKEYAPLFRYKKDSQSKTLSSDFDKRLSTAIREQEKENKYITVKIFAPALRIAASVALITGLGIGIYLVANQNKKNYFAETYNDPNAALKHATFALDKLSDALKKGEEASMESLRELEELNLDWAALDSLNMEQMETNHSEIPVETENL
ncbi:MAG: hypothetical protein PHO94_07665 [Petrimonas sp.]|nr:hypothetical protein [Petrimonas sp.]